VRIWNEDIARAIASDRIDTDVLYEIQTSGFTSYGEPEVVESWELRTDA